MLLLAGSQVCCRAEAKSPNCSIPPDLHKGIADQMNMVSRLVSFADSHRA